MNEHEDDVEPEVEDGVEFEVEAFPILEDEESEDEKIGVDPDPSEI